jgi:phosphate transport system permease protein
MDPSPAGSPGGLVDVPHPGTPTRFAGRDTRRADRIFAGIARSAGILVLVIIAAIAIFLVLQARSSLGAVHGGLGGFLSQKQWNPDAPNHVFGIAALVFGTVVAAALALLFATPIAVGVALFTTEYAPRRLASLVSSLTDLLAAVPSVIYGLWGALFLAPRMSGLGRFLTQHFSGVPVIGPLFRNTTGNWTGSLFVAGVVLAVMILPIVTAIAREVFKQTPLLEKEAAIGLGATKLEMIRLTVLPFGKAGVVSGAMLGLGRALGETIAVALVLSAANVITPHILAPGGNTIAANVSLLFQEAGSLGRSALIASGLVLFIVTFAVNFLARAIIARSGVAERSAV